ncbi:tRNA pseudouridine(13) synthase TruD [Psychrobacter sp.]|uniref:tRNA pseudouridine(13) synthase TruD n=1 Tax=Psychrobacter sp. TaxID=56811 RepID=UPI0025E2A866|nr:tRNA pseudouridine(13) synthase TruD [Psychrobacter sp.]
MTVATAPSNIAPITAEQIKHLTNSQYLAQPYPAPILKASFKGSASDFQVDELMQLEHSGEGEHLWMQIKKTGMNTNFVAEQLAKWAKIPSRDVGYSGLKDRQAVTTQWFSLRIPKGQLPEISFKEFIHTSTRPTRSHHSSNQEGILDSQEAVEVLQQVWHSKKLNRGTHKSNRFVIRLTDIELNPEVAPTIDDVDKVLLIIAKAGVPNYFGEQRFGRQGNNIASALEWFEEGTIHGRPPHPKKSRDLQSLLLSSARSAIFNQIVCARVAQSDWNTGLNGEVFNLEGSGSVFATQHMDDELKQRLASGDIHPTAPLWGVNNDKVTGDAKALEDQIVANHPILQRLAHGLIKKDLKTMRRAIRLPVSDLTWSWREVIMDKHELILHFTLPTGTFATSVLANLVAELSQ